jgi:hypothetical protein
MALQHLPRREKTESGMEEWLANPWSRKKITKTTHAGRGQETIWEIPIDIARLTVSNRKPIYQPFKKYKQTRTKKGPKHEIQNYEYRHGRVYTDHLAGILRQE